MICYVAEARPHPQMLRLTPFQQPISKEAALPSCARFKLASYVLVQMLMACKGMQHYWWFILSFFFIHSFGQLFQKVLLLCWNNYSRRRNNFFIIVEQLFASEKMFRVKKIFDQKIIQMYPSEMLFWRFLARNTMMQSDFNLNIRFEKYNFFFSCLVSS